MLNKISLGLIVLTFGALFMAHAKPTEKELNSEMYDALQLANESLDRITSDMKEVDPWTQRAMRDVKAAIAHVDEAHKPKQRKAGR